MKKALLLIAIFSCLKISASAQQTYFYPGIPPSSTSFSPTFRFNGTDSLANFFLSNSNRWSQIYTAAQSNLRFLQTSDTATFNNGIAPTGIKTYGLGGTLIQNTSVDLSGLRLELGINNTYLTLNDATNGYVNLVGGTNTDYGELDVTFNQAYLGFTNPSGTSFLNFTGSGNILRDAADIGIQNQYNYHAGMLATPYALIDRSFLDSVGAARYAPLTGSSAYVKYSDTSTMLSTYARLNGVHNITVHGDAASLIAQGSTTPTDFGSLEHNFIGVHHGGGYVGFNQNGIIINDGTNTLNINSPSFPLGANNTLYFPNESGTLATLSDISGTYLTKANNLSDVASPSTTATNLGLGTGNSPSFAAVYQNTLRSSTEIMASNNLIMYDDFDRANTTLGVLGTATSGATYDMRGAGGVAASQTQIINNQWVSQPGDIAYAITQVPQSAVTRMGARISFGAGNSGASQATFSMLVSSNTSGTNFYTNTAIHIAVTRTAWTITYTNGGTFYPVANGTFPNALANNGTIYPMEISLDGVNCYYNFAGTTGYCTSPYFSSQQGSYATFEHYYATSSVSETLIINSMWIGATPITSTPDPTYNDVTISSLSGLTNTYPLFIANNSLGNSDVVMRNYGGYPRLIVGQAGGTFASPSNTTANQILYRNEITGYQGSGGSGFTTESARIYALATENFVNGTNNGTVVKIGATATGTATLTDQLAVWGSGVSIGQTNNAALGFLDLAAGTTAIPSMYWRAGASLLTTPVNGAQEYISSTSSMYLTMGGTRYQYMLSQSAPSLGSIPYGSTTAMHSELTGNGILRLNTGSAPTISKVTITEPATSATITVANGKTLTYNNSITIAGTDATTITFPNVSGSVPIGGTITWPGTLYTTPTTGTVSAAGVLNFSPILTTQTANTVLVGPTTGAAAEPTFRALVLADMPVGSVPLIQGTADLTAQTTAGTITTFTVGSTTATFNVSGYINVTAVATDVIELQITYTDENSNAQTVTFTTLSSIANSTYNPVTIRAKNGSVITAKTTLTTGIGSITFDAGARISQL